MALSFDLYKVERILRRLSLEEDFTYGEYLLISEARSKRYYKSDSKRADDYSKRLFHFLYEKGLIEKSGNARMSTRTGKKRNTFRVVNPVTED